MALKLCVCECVPVYVCNISVNFVPLKREYSSFEMILEG